MCGVNMNWRGKDFVSMCQSYSPEVLNVGRLNRDVLFGVDRNEDVGR